MSFIQPVVEQDKLYLDTREVLAELLNTLRADDRGQVLMQALRLATCGRPVFAASCADRVDGQIEAPSGEQNLPAVGASMTDEVLAALVGPGLVRRWTVAQDTATATYLSEGRILTAVLVLRPFTLYRRHDGEWLPATEADEPGERPVSVVPEGWYLVAEAGGAAPCMVGVVGIDSSAFRTGGEDTAAEDAEDTARRLADVIADSEGFGASRCHARCAGCGGRWYADEGSWHFSPEVAGGDVAWEFDDADGFDAGTIACPNCCTGRVSFRIS
jgi:hypothetical protein